MIEVFEKNLNPQQLEAVRHLDGPLMVVAGAGSGKTRVITFRMAYLIYQGIPASRILGLTFTNKAADEMKERVQSLVHAAPLVSTFHSFGARILRNEIRHLGYTGRFVIYDEDDSLRVVKDVLDALNMKEDVFSPQQARVAISNSKNEAPAGRLSGFRSASDKKKLKTVFDAYHEVLRRNNAVDFDDLLLLPLKLFQEHPAVLESYQERYLYLLVDEYQDTNSPQYRLIKMLCGKHRNICVVGDPDQSIYRWRGSDIRNILNFENDFPGTKKVVLEQNYRSTTRILQAANSLIRYNTRRKTKNLWSEIGEGEEVLQFVARDHEEEAELVTQLIQHLVQNNDLAYRDMAVFYRTHAQSRALEESLRAEDIPYVVIGGPGFYGRKEVKDILAYLRILVTPGDGVSVMRVINVPKRGIGKTTIDRLVAASRDRRVPLYEVAQQAVSLEGLPTSARKAVSSFVQIIEEFRKKVETLAPQKLAEKLINKIGYFEMLKKEFPDDADDRIDNLYELLDTMQTFRKENPDAGLADYLERISLISDIDRWQDKENRVSLMTVHNSKGLEFDAVTIVGLEEGIFPHANSLEDLDKLEEERRLCYVGMTRAKRFLCVTSAERRLRHGLFMDNEPSRFVSEMFEAQEKRADEREKDIAQASRRIASKRGRIDKIPDLREGDRVVHPAFGPGTVVALEAGYEETFVRVLFDGDSDAKLLSPAFAQLKKT
jgi:DNA helicase II / ATP-dependent DNA helicase PcrA